MLQRHTPRPSLGSDDYLDDRDRTLDLEFLVGTLRRRWRGIVALAMAGLLLGLAYLLTAIPLYTSTTRLLLDTPATQTARDVSGISDGIFESGEIDSQVELIRSESIAVQVVDSLDLADNAAFLNEQKNTLQIVAGFARQLASVLLPSSGISSGEDPLAAGLLTSQELAHTQRRGEALQLLQNGLSVGRVNRTFVLHISFTSHDRRMAALIANAFAAAYIDDQLEAKYAATRRASDWLLSRTEELRLQAANAEQAVGVFRQANGLAETSGTLVADQQLAELNGQLIAARAEASLLRARHSRLLQIVADDDPSAVVNATLGQSITADLRARYLEASKRFSEISELLGADHAQAVRQSNEMAQFQRLMFEEMRRVTDATGNELQVSLDQIEVLESDIGQLAGISTAENEVRIQLRELERSATSLRSLYDSFLERYQVSLQTQSFPISDARVITPAEVPTIASSPHSSLTLAIALLAGGVAGLGISMVQELHDRVFRTGEQVRNALGLEFIGMLPLVGDRAPAPGFPRKQSEAPPPDGSMDMMRYATTNPLSGFSETLRSAKIAMDITIVPNTGEGRVIGITSALPGEGKTSVSKNLASLLASQGARVLLIDGDLRNPALTGKLAPQSQVGIVDILLEGKSVRDIAKVEGSTGLQFVPGAIHRQISHTSDLLASPSMRQLLGNARKSYDYVLVDLPPVLPVVDVRALADLIDGLLFIIEWGKTDRKMISDLMSSDLRLADKIIGVILNKTDTERLKLYENYRAGADYENAYAKYYQH